MRAIGALVGLAFALATVSAFAQDNQIRPGALPIPPCAGDPSPAYPDIGDTPDVRVWRDEEITGWRRPNCAGLGPLAPNALVAVAGRFRSEGGIEAITARIAAISTLTTIRYYSVRADKWQPLFVAAYALADSPSGNASNVRRPDFRADDMDSGRTLRFWQEENSLLSGVAYRLTVLERGPDRLVYTIVNESPAKALLLTASEPGEFRQVYEIDHETGDIWRYYSLVEARMHMGPFNLSSRSLRSRTIAFYRHIAGYPTEADIKTMP